MNYAMEDTQNSAPGSLPAAQVAKLGAPRRGPDAQSTTKRSAETAFAIFAPRYNTDSKIAYRPS
jgi:hypothetical protein